MWIVNNRKFQEALQHCNLHRQWLGRARVHKLCRSTVRPAAAWLPPMLKSFISHISFAFDGANHDRNVTYFADSRQTRTQPIAAARKAQHNTQPHNDIHSIHSFIHSAHWSFESWAQQKHTYRAYGTTNLYEFISTRAASTRLLFLFILSIRHFQSPHPIQWDFRFCTILFSAPIAILFSSSIRRSFSFLLPFGITCSRRWCCCCWDARRHTGARSWTQRCTREHRERRKKSRNDDDVDDCDLCGAQHLKNEILMMRIYWSRCCWTLFCHWKFIPHEISICTGRASGWASAAEVSYKSQSKCTCTALVVLSLCCLMRRPCRDLTLYPLFSLSYPIRFGVCVCVF